MSLKCGFSSSPKCKPAVVKVEAGLIAPHPEHCKSCKAMVNVPFPASSVHKVVEYDCPVCKFVNRVHHN
jgi:hypothetical protein